jgi:hypothetical protein
MEESVNYLNGDDMFPWLPIGHMIAYSGPIPTNFLAVDGQKLYKSEHPTVYNTLRGCVVEDEDTFALPRKENVAHLFSSYHDGVDYNIIIRVT